MEVFLLLGGFGVLLLVLGLVVGDVLSLDGVADLGPITTPVLGAAFAAFGLAGAFVLRPLGTLLAVVVGLVAALALGGVTVGATRALMGPPGEPVRTSALLGVFGVLVTRIPDDGLGEVVLPLGGQPRQARGQVARGRPDRDRRVRRGGGQRDVRGRPARRPAAARRPHQGDPPVSPVLIALASALGLVLLVLAAIVGRIKVAGPNEAFLITGRKGRPVTNPETGLVSTDMSGQKVIMGASVFVLPFVQKLHVLELSSRRLQVGIRGAVSPTASSATSRASRSSRSPAPRTPSARPPSASWTSRTTSRSSPRRCSPARCARSSAG